MAKYIVCPNCGNNLDHGEKCSCGWYEGIDNENIVYIGVEHIHPHPNNPRKDLGDLSELAESIRKNGIMQNLTVIPSDEPEEYITIIGHRRYAAAKEAGLDKLPCRIVTGLSENEQLGVMLEENMQRADLTILEQAEGFQLMLDLGETEDSIAEKTGFSKTTVKRRLNIAKLDKDLLKEKMEVENSQINLTDLYELEKLKDVKERNKILKNSYNSNNLRYAVKSAIDNARIKENFKHIAEMFEGMGIKKAPKEYEKERYNRNIWQTIAQIHIGADDFRADEYKPDFEVEGDMYYDKFSTYWIYVAKKLEQAEDGEESEEEIAKNRIEANSDEIKERLVGMDNDRKYLIGELVNGRIKIPDESKAQDDIWHWFINSERSISFAGGILKYFTDKPSWNLEEDELSQIKEEVIKLKTVYSMFIALHATMTEVNLVDWKCHYLRKNGNKLKEGYEIFSKYLGWSYAEGDEAIIDGTSNLYEKAEEEEG